MGQEGLSAIRAAKRAAGAQVPQRRPLSLSNTRLMRSI
jgi:hypothetical protein